MKFAFESNEPIVCSHVESKMFFRECVNVANESNTFQLADPKFGIALPGREKSSVYSGAVLTCRADELIVLNSPDLVEASPLLV